VEALLFSSSRFRNQKLSSTLNHQGVSPMKLGLNFCLALIACLALSLLTVNGVRAQDMGTEPPPPNNPAMTSAEAEGVAPGTRAEQSPNVRSQERLAAQCESMSMGMRGPHHEMMGMGMGMMGMPMMQEHMAMMRMMEKDPKMAGHMLEMRADMMRAMANVMEKYGKQMESGQWQTSSATENNSGKENNTGSQNQNSPSSNEASSSGEY
jgi:hypothetical protein